MVPSFADQNREATGLASHDEVAVQQLDALSIAARTYAPNSSEFRLTDAISSEDKKT